jgi:hypothetical protein
MLPLDYIAGYLDGDGCIRIEKRVRPMRNAPLYRPVVTCGSVCPAVPSAMKEMFGGSVSIRRTRIPNHKPLYLWTRTENRTALFLQEISRHLVIKRDQAQRCIELSTGESFVGKSVPAAVTTERERLFTTVKTLNAKPHCPHDCSQISNEYIAGIFDAEGNVTVQRTRFGTCRAHVVIVNSCGCIANHLKATFGGVIRKRNGHYYWVAMCSGAQRFIDSVLPYLTVKRERCELASELRKHIEVRTGFKTPQVKIDAMLDIRARMKDLNAFTG